MRLLELFLIFVKMGAILLGGGYVILPIITSEFADKRKLITHDEILDYFALSQSLPGIIAANISVFIGYKLKGKTGAVTAFLGIIFVPFWSIVLLASVLGILVENTFVQGALRGVGIAIIALIMLTIREMWQKSNRNTYFYAIYGITLIALFLFNLTPIQAILIFSILGVLYKKIREVKE